MFYPTFIKIPNTPGWNADPVHDTLCSHSGWRHSLLYFSPDLLLIYHCIRTVATNFQSNPSVLCHTSAFSPCFPSFRMGSWQPLFTETSSDEASGLCWIFSCFWKTWLSDTVHLLKIFFRPATSILFYVCQTVLSLNGNRLCVFATSC